MKHLSDEAIIGLYFDRDERAIAETDNKYRRFLRSIAKNIVLDESDCEECLNDTYLRTWNAIPPERPAVLKAFLATVMRRTALDRYKESKRKKRVPSELTASLSEIEDFVSDEGDLHTELEAKELARVLDDFVRALPDRQMYIFMSRYYTARPIAEIASKLGCSQSTVHKEIALIKRKLKEKLESEGYTV